MRNQNRLLLIPVCFLAACASQKPLIEVQANENFASVPNTPRQSKSTNTLSEPVLKNETLKQAKVKDKSKDSSLRNADSISAFTISGAMSAKNKNKGWSASLNWAQQGANHYQIRLMGPLGGGTVLINRQGGVLTYKEGSKTFSSSNADALLEKHTGIHLPVANLYYWVRGMPAPGGRESIKKDNANHLSQLTQNGYTINYSRYGSVNGLVLPGLIQLHGQGAAIKLVIKQWKVR